MYALVQSDQQLHATLDGTDATLRHLDSLDGILHSMQDRLQVRRLTMVGTGLTVRVGARGGYGNYRVQAR